MAGSKLIELRPLKSSVNIRRAVRDCADRIPVLPETLLSLELLIRERLIDLSELVRVVRRDCGAVLQLMRLTGLESPSPPEADRRIEDCLASLDLQFYVGSMTENALEWTANHAQFRGTWVHAREIAALCESVAEVQSSDVNPANAYVVGLFHELGGLPDALNWNAAVDDARDEDSLGLDLAMSWSLPTAVQSYFRNRIIQNSACRWSEIVSHAHRLSSGLESPAAYCHSSDLFYLATPSSGM